jgi:hypothetical protein
VLIVKYFVIVGAILAAGLWMLGSAPTRATAPESNLEATLHQLAGTPDITTMPALTRGLRTD